MITKDSGWIIWFFDSVNLHSLKLSSYYYYLLTGLELNLRKNCEIIIAANQANNMLKESLDTFQNRKGLLLFKVEAMTIGSSSEM